MSKQTLHTCTSTCEVVEIKGEAMLKVTHTGITHANYTGTKTTYAKQDEVILYMPLYYIPYMMRQQRESIAKWEKRQLDFIKRVKEAYKQDVILPEQKLTT